MAFSPGWWKYQPTILREERLFFLILFGCGYAALGEMARQRSMKKQPSPRVPDPSPMPGSAGPGIPGATPAREGRVAWLALLLVLVVWAAFSPILDNDFVGWDDPLNFLENKDFRGLGWSQIHWAWTTSLLGVYQPLSWMLLETEYAIWGLDPGGYHLTSLVLFSLNALLLYALVIALLHRCCPAESTRLPWAFHVGAILAVALFVAHPLRVEVVAWVSCQPYLPCALFLMLAVLAYFRAHPAGRPVGRGWSITAFLLFAAALLCKAVAVPLPLVLLILDVYPLRRLEFRRDRLWERSTWFCLLEKVPYFALSLLVALVAVRARAMWQNQGTTSSLSELPARLGLACYGTLFYPLKTLWPAGITAYYPLPAPSHWDETAFVLGRLLVLVVTVALILARRTLPGCLAAWLSYLVILAPNSGLIRFGDQLAADRFSYIAMLGLVPLLAVALARTLRPIVSRYQPAVILLLVGSIMLVEINWTRTQCLIWRNSTSLWKHVYEHGGAGNGDVLNNLGYALTLDKKPGEALPYLTESLRLNPRSPMSHHSLGTALEALGRVDEAKAEFQEALRYDPRHPESRRDLARLLAQKKNTPSVPSSR